MDNLKQSIEIDVKVTPAQVADLFCSMDNDEQAEFFNTVYDISQTWPICNFDLQMLSASKSDRLTDGGRHVMGTIGIFATEERNDN